MSVKLINIITNVIGFLMFLFEPVKSYLMNETFNWGTFLLCIGGAVIAYFTSKSTIARMKANGEPLK